MPSAPHKLHAVTRRNERSPALLPSTGKYWARLHNAWQRVLVTDLPAGGGTGRLVLAPVARERHLQSSMALANAEYFVGPVPAWGTKAPRVGKAKLLEARAKSQ